MKLEELTALYSSLDIEYSQAMSGSYEDLSFRSDEITIIAGLKDGRISGFWRPVVAVGDDKLQKLHIERLYDICQNIYYMDFLIDGNLSVISQFLLRYRYKARPYYTQIIDLTKPIEQLYTDLRKSYKQLVKIKDPWLDVLSSQSTKTMRLIRKKVGHKDRCEESWKVQDEMIRQGQAFYVGGDGSMILCCHNKYSAYYFSGISHPEKNSHHLVWRAIDELQSLGCKSFEMGEQIFTGDEKLVNISKFKRGFGGTCQTKLILEKE